MPVRLALARTRPKIIAMNNERLFLFVDGLLYWLTVRWDHQIETRLAIPPIRRKGPQLVPAQSLLPALACPEGNRICEEFA
jgi:hypothetical protein